MAKNPFTSVSDVTRKIGKNYYDWSHDYNFTGKIGTIYPVFAKYCPAGQSLSIDAVAGLQFMPMQFPVQSKMKMKLSFWRMPLRAMWKDYTNLVSSQNQPDVQKNYIAPYIDFNHSGAYTDMLAVGGLCDYLRIPCVLNEINWGASVSFPSGRTVAAHKTGVFTSVVAGTNIGNQVADSPAGGTCLAPSAGYYVPYDVDSSIHLTPTVDVSSLVYSLYLSFSSEVRMIDFKQCVDLAITTKNVGLVFTNVSSPFTVVGKCIAYKCEHIIDTYTLRIDMKLDSGSMVYSPGTSIRASFFFPNSDFCFDIPANPSSELSYPKWNSSRLDVTSVGTSRLDSNTSPYYDSSSENSEKQLKLSAYPFRMYEAIYNAYIRYIRNNPFKKGGKAVYNEWLPTMEGGADKTPYKLHRCNWAADAYTTAVQSPQQGVAPLVGLSQATVVGEDGISRVVPAITTEDGKVYGVEFKANEFGIEGVNYTELGTGAKVAPVHSMYGLSQSGISIEDFRMTNAYQRYLELNMMRGYSYKQIVEGRFEVNVKYDDLLMPEFCGGMTRDVFVSGVQQNVEDNGGSGTYIGSLGSEAGIAGCRGDLGHKVKIYCDEASYVMVLAYVVPQSIYSQVCPKDFLYRDLLDAWSPEFDQIGFQPIKNSELCPVESWNVSPDKLNETFGFQRPWHEYCEVLDASVGLFNTEMRNFLMHRVFSSVPQLGEKFTTVNPESVDHVFSVTEFTDKFFGQIHFSIDVKSPVSRVVIPSLE